jgi:hypothetical protein
VVDLLQAAVEVEVHLMELILVLVVMVVVERFGVIEYY